MISAGEQVIMQTALVETDNTDQTRKYITRIIMDTGSQRTYISQDMVNKLKIKPVGTYTFTVFTFGASKPKDLTTPIVEIMMKSKEGNRVLIRASVVPQITGMIQRTPVKTGKSVCTSRDTLPNQVQSSTISLLIVNDYYNDLVSSERVKIKDGLYLIKSRFGWIFSRRMRTDENKKKSKTRCL